MTLVGLPYVAWVSALQALPDSRSTLLLIGDIICIIPQVAFQRGLGAVIEVSSKSNDPDLSWQDVWKFESRVWYTILIMFVIGSLEWVYLNRLTTGREPSAEIQGEEAERLIQPLDVSHDDDIHAERERSLNDDFGVNARDLVKVFLVKPTKGSNTKDPIMKRSVKGVSFGVKPNEIFALLGPNGTWSTCNHPIPTFPNKNIRGR